VNTEAERSERAISVAKEAVLTFVLAAIIRHHPNREDVLCDLRKLHVIEAVDPEIHVYRTR
jgi:hypothetical protein